MVDCPAPIGWGLSVGSRFNVTTRRGTGANAAAAVGGLNLVALAALVALVLLRRRCTGRPARAAFEAEAATTT